jgi:hypothetical protein
MSVIVQAPDQEKIIVNEKKVFLILQITIDSTNQTIQTINDTIHRITDNVVIHTNDTLDQGPML